ncbi:neurofilament light polypeptide-like [Alligator mississippiensis]|uniref:neurofilament light polypeptide-like n=1 Tax=Alligator mississippiensis TaxID=8496 RepID=UPI002877D4A5|nr:neurofilament light polypeptide-like [Alligator mississippiensis]
MSLGARRPRAEALLSLRRPGPELAELRAQETGQLAALNDRLAAYAERVRALERRNRALRLELEALRGQLREPPRLRALYEQEARSLRGRLQAEAGEKRRLEGEREQLRGLRARLSERCAEEARKRRGAEEALRGAREAAARAALGGRAAEGRAGGARRELAFLRRLCAEEGAELAARARSAGAEPTPAPAPAAARPDLAATLGELRAQYEALAGKNRQAAQDWYRTRCASAADVAARHGDAARGVRRETAHCRRLLRTRAAELQALRGAVAGLHRRLRERQERQSGEVARCQERVEELEQQVGAARLDMARYLREYQDLLHVKMALDVEIVAYRKLLEGEELRFASAL